MPLKQFWIALIKQLRSPVTYPDLEPLRRGLTYQSVLFIAVLKWFILASITGAIVGFATTGFLKLLEWSVKFGEVYPYTILLLPVGMAASAAMTHYIVPEAKGHGTEKVIEAVHRRSGRISPLVVPVKLLATLVTIAFGGSVGKEGPCAQIGAGIASQFANLVRFSDVDRKKLVICGISAGFASVFGTPIAGAIFGVEVLVIGGLMYDVLLPSFIAGMVSFHISSAFGIIYLHHPLKYAPVFSESLLFTVLVAAVFFGIVGALLSESLRRMDSLVDSLKLWPPAAGALGGLIVVALSFVFSRQYLGLGLTTIEDALGGHPVQWYAFLAKILFTSITLAFWGSGGIVTPIFFIGATAGLAFATWFGLPLTTYAAIGMVSVLAGAANTPIAASIMSIEMFGPAIGPYAAVACVVSFLIGGYRSVYPSQILGIAKSESLRARLGEEIGTLEPELGWKSRRWLASGLRVFRKRNRGWDKDEDD
jgi:H+/Cl- antiporter ClcA